MIDLLINFSGGLIENKKQAQLILLVITIIFVILTLFIFISGFSKVGKLQSKSVENFNPDNEREMFSR